MVTPAIRGCGQGDLGAGAARKVTLACRLVQCGPFSVNVSAMLSVVGMYRMEQVKVTVPMVTSEVKTIHRLHCIC